MPELLLHYEQLRHISARKCLKMRANISGTYSSLRLFLRDETGNTLVMTAAAIMPMLALVGGAVDMSRQYLVESRLQSACDAGALAARRSMSGVTWNDASRQVGMSYFGMNFSEGKYATGSIEVDYTANGEGEVTGDATVQVPMTLMQIFGADSSQISVNCTADLSLPNTDIMMVLDTTLSMNDINPGDSISRIVALRNAVTSFYSTLESVTPAGTTIRYGFVPYSHTVNVGLLLKKDWLRDFGTYDSRVQDGIHTWTTGGVTTTTTTTPPPTLTNRSNRIVSGTFSTLPRYQGPSERCGPDRPNTLTAIDSGWTGWSPSASALPRTRTRRITRNGFQYNVSSDSSGNCWITPQQWNNQITEETETVIRNPDTTTRTTTTTSPIQTHTRRHWFYRPVQYDLRPFKGNGPGDATVPGGSFTAQINDNQTNRTITWPVGDRACIEERATRRTNEFVTPRHDMDIDLIPNPSDPDTQWKPYLPTVVFARNVGAANRANNTTISTNPNQDDRWIFSDLPQTSTRTINLGNEYNYWNPSSTGDVFEGACPSPARKLGAITQTQLSSYLSSLRPQGYTYHEIGMIWGLRLISREGLFADEHSLADARGSVQRHMIFMVDGDMDTRPFTYSAWGVAGTARRRTPTGSFPSRAAEDSVSAQRLSELCTIAKNNKNITLWVIAFGTRLDQYLVDCASPGRAFEARNAQELTDAFSNIASQISELRLTS
jgi:Flp pilus assembly protein TadG